MANLPYNDLHVQMQTALGGQPMGDKRDRAGLNRREVLGTAGALAAGGVLLTGGAAAGA